MTLSEFFQVGSDAFSRGADAFSTPIPYIDNYSLLDIFSALMFLQIAGWFAARIVKGKSAQAPGNEPPDSDITVGDTGGEYVETVQQGVGRTQDQYFADMRREASEESDDTWSND